MWCDLVLPTVSRLLPLYCGTLLLDYLVLYATGPRPTGSGFRKTHKVMEVGELRL
jgi:hypothetical protein